MKYRNKLMVFFLFLLFGYGTDVFASFTYKIDNQTGKDVRVQLYSLFGEQNKGVGLIKSGSNQKLTVSLCLSKIEASIRVSRKWGNYKEVKVKNRSGKSISIAAGECGSRAFILKRVSGEIVATML